MKSLFALLISLVMAVVPFNGFEKNKNPDIGVSKSEAKAIVLKHSGLDASDIKRYKVELDKERNVVVYEIEFDSGKYEYDYEVDANNGKVLKAQKEIRD